mgnify:CR=1 FL=1
MFPFGVTFYPDQWPKEYWEKAFSQIAASGFNIVRFGEMAWNWVEPREGEFCFEDLDKALSMADKHGLKVLLGIPTSMAPAWLIRKYPEVRPVSNEGTLYPEYGPRPNICRDNKTFRKFAQRLLEKMVERYKDHPAVLNWQIDNEPVYPPLDSTTNMDFCHCAETKRDFMEWAKKKYGTLEEINRVWGAKFWTNEFGEFEDITTPKAGVWDAGNPHIFLDWFRFKTDSLHEFLMWEKDLVRKLDGSRKIGTNGFLGICQRVPEHDIMSEGLEWYGWDIYPMGGRNTSQQIAEMADWWRSAAEHHGGEFHVTELQGGPNVRWGYPGFIEGPEIRIWTHQIIAHGAKAVLYHQWRTAKFGGETGGFGILKADGTRTKRLEAIEQAGSEIKTIIPELHSRKLLPKAAVAYLRSSDVQTYQEQGPPRTIAGQWEQVRAELGHTHGLDSCQGAYQVLWNYYNPSAFIFESHLEKGEMPYNVILLPNPYVLTRAQAQNLIKFVESGGTLVTESRFGTKNENAHLHETPLLEEMLGISSEHIETIDDRVYIPKLRCWAYGFRDLIHTETEHLMEYKDGLPAFIEKKIGNGKVLYATFSLFMSIGKTGNERLADYVREYLPKPEFFLKDKDHIEMILWQDGNSPLLYVINHSPSKDKFEIDTPENFKIARDLLSGNTFEIEKGKLPLVMGGRCVMVLILS